MIGGNKKTARTPTERKKPKSRSDKSKPKNESFTVPTITDSNDVPRRRSTPPRHSPGSRKRSIEAKERRRVPVKDESSSSSLSVSKKKPTKKPHKPITPAKEEAKHDESGSTAEEPPFALETVTNPPSTHVTLRSFATECKQLTMEGIKNYFDCLRPNQNWHECRGSHLTANQAKNRYDNIHCLDATKVVLRFETEDYNSCYINANRVDYASLAASFILTQAPIPNTVYDFWRMIWQEKTNFIIMLCNFVENERNKCSEYFPLHARSSIVVESFRLTTTHRRTENNGLVISAIQIAHGKEQRLITHFQVTEWPDYDSPNCNADQLFGILEKTRSSNTPIVMHCSAGVGRSGTMVATEILLMDIIKGHPISLNHVNAVVNFVRNCRWGAVQNKKQYLTILLLILKFGVKLLALDDTDCRHIEELIQLFHQRH